MKKICFVCLGNICRSPTAEFVMKDMVKRLGIEKEYMIESRATGITEVGNDMYYATKEKLEEKHIPYTTHKATHLEAEEYSAFDYFIGMDQSNIRDIKYIFGSDKENKVFRFLDITPLKRDIKDPWYTRDFEQTYQDVLIGCQELLIWLER